MNYFTKEELNFIVDELLNNPSKETLKSLSDRYNVKEEVVTVPIEQPALSTVPIEPLNNSTPTLDNNVSISNNMNNQVNSIPSIELPQTSVSNLQSTNNTAQVPFNGNLWEPETVNVNSMMQPTNNFTNSMPFNSNVQSANNNNQGPTMFGQMEKNVGNVA